MVDPRTKQLRMEDFERLCQQRGIPCTFQRRVIFDAVLGSGDHPTADQVFKEVSARQRGISRATVHRTLETLFSLGMITRACHPGKVIRYDARTEIHHHLVCMHCDKIIDFQDERLDSLHLPDTSTFGFETTGYQVQLRGICRDCRQEPRGI